MKVALCTREYPPEVYGGAGVHVEFLARALAGHVEVEVHAFGEPRPDPLVVATYQPWDALAGGAPHMAALRTFSVDLAMAAGVEGADLVHTHTWYANLAGHLAKQTYGIPHVMTSHSLEPLRPWKREQLGGGYELSLWAERTAARVGRRDHRGVRGNARRHPAQLPGGRSRARARHPQRRRHRRVPARSRRATGWPRSASIPTCRPSSSSAASRSRKGCRTCSTRPRTCRPVLSWSCARARPTRHRSARRWPRASPRCVTRGALRVIWIREMLPRDVAVRVLSRATVFVCPSIYEPFGLVNVEAMACGIPVVASAVGGIPEIVVDGETGFLVPFEPGDDAFGSPADPAGFARDLADRIGELLADPARARAMGVASRARVEARFAWPAIAEKTVALYRTLVGGGVGAGGGRAGGGAGAGRRAGGGRGARAGRGRAAAACWRRGGRRGAAARAARSARSARSGRDATARGPAHPNGPGADSAWAQDRTQLRTRAVPGEA